MRLLLFLLIAFAHSSSRAVSFLSFDPISMATGGAGSATGAGGPQPFLSPATFGPGGDCCVLSVYGGARAIDREHFLATAKQVRDWHDQLNVEDQLNDAEYALEPEHLQSDPIRRLGSTAEQLVLALNSLPNKPLRVGASAGAYALGQNQSLSAGVFDRRYLVVGAIISNHPQDIVSISAAQSTLYVVSDLIDDIKEIGELIKAVDQHAITELVRSSVEQAEIDARLLNYQELPGVAPLLHAVRRLEGNIKRLDEHVDLRQLMTDLISQNRDITDDETSFDAVNPRDYLHQPLPEKINSRVLFSGAEVEEHGVNFSVAVPASPSITLGLNLKEMTFSTIDFVQRLDQFDIDQYQHQSTRNTYHFWNVDIGVRYQLSPNWAAGAVVKNIRRKHMLTARGNSLQLEPIARVGLSYTNSSVILSADADLTKNEPLGFDPQKQYVALGAQINYWRKNNVRLGYRYNFVDGTGLPAAGLGFKAWYYTIDLAATYSPGNQEAGASLQTGMKF